MDEDRSQDRTPDQTRDWRELCKAAATELNPVKLMDIIAELTRALDERDKNRWANNVEKTGTKSGGPRSLRDGLAV